MYLPKTENILSFLKPMEIDQKLDLLSDLKEMIIKNNPKYTALPKDFFESVLQDVSSYKKLPKGSWVEVGVWKGGGGLFFKCFMDEIGIDENFYLFDTYGKIPKSKITHQKDIDFVNSFKISEQASYLTEVQDLFNQFKLNENVYFIESDVHDVGKQEVPDKIAFLFIDVDFFEPVYKSLVLFYDNLVQGGVLIIDDYYMSFLNCKEAVDTFFEERNIDLSIISSRFSSFAIKIIKQ